MAMLSTVYQWFKKRGYRRGHATEGRSKVWTLTAPSGIVVKFDSQAARDDYMVDMHSLLRKTRGPSITRRYR